MRKYSPILLLTVLFLPLAGYHIIFHWQQAKIKAEMKERVISNIPAEEQQIFRFSLNDRLAQSKLQWEDEHEFKLDGSMYDVIEKKIENGEIIIRCINDQIETDLIKKYEKLNRENGSNSKNPSALLIKMLGNSFIISGQQEFCFLKQLLKSNSGSLNVIISSHSRDVLTPPPQFG